MYHWLSIQPLTLIIPSMFEGLYCIVYGLRDLTKQWRRKSKEKKEREENGNEERKKEEKNSKNFEKG